MDITPTIKWFDPRDMPEQGDLYKPHHLHVRTLHFGSRALPGMAPRDPGRTPRRSKPLTYLCDWYPRLFGIDEDRIPPSEDEEGTFEVMLFDLEERAQAFTQEELDRMRVGSRECLTNDELREIWLNKQHPLYGRRARVKQRLLGDDNKPFRCICRVDKHYNRHYVPNFGGGVPRKGEEFKIPHFKAFWEDFREKGEYKEMDDMLRELETEVPEKKKEEFSHPTTKFENWTKKSIRNMRDGLLSQFRPLHCREVRRYRIPYAEALYLELQEDDCLNSAAFFKHLIITDHFVHKAPNSSGGRLRDNNFFLDNILQFLKMGEKFNKREEYQKESHLYLRTGKLFNDFGSTWWWLAEEFYKKAVQISEKCVIDGGKSEAISNYILGTFLLDCVDRVQPAQEHLLRARELAMGKDWNARAILQRPQETVHKECVTYLCRALIATSKELRKRGKPEEALPLIHRSYKLCGELGSGHSDIEMETYFELGMTYQAVGMLDWAKAAFRKFIGLAEMQKFVKGICDGYLELAICYRSEGDFDRCRRNISSFLNAALTHDNQNLVAFGNRYLGEYLLNSGHAKDAALHLNMAFKSFLQQRTECSQIPFADWQPEHFTLPGDVELTRVLTGLAEGQSLTGLICSLIYEVQDSKNQDTLMKLIHWKNSGEKSKVYEAAKILKANEAEQVGTEKQFELQEQAIPQKLALLEPSVQPLMQRQFHAQQRQPEAETTVRLTQETEDESNRTVHFGTRSYMAPDHEPQDKIKRASFRLT